MWKPLIQRFETIPGQPYWAKNDVVMVERLDISDPGGQFSRKAAARAQAQLLKVKYPDHLVVIQEFVNGKKKGPPEKIP